MRMTRGTLFCVVMVYALLATAGAAVAQDERQMIDGIAAIVGDEIILESEVDEEFYIYQMRTGAEIRSEEAAEIRISIVREMVEEMLLVAKARRDSIVVQDEDLEAEIDRRVSDLRDRHGSDEALKDALAEEGITLEDLKKLYRDDIERRLLAEKVVRGEVHSSIDVTWGEVSRYYEEHRDEVAEVPESFRLAGILVVPEPSESAKRQAIERLTEAREKLAEGVPFEDVASEYSDDASAARGGDLGSVRRGMMVPEFEDAAFSLQEGEVSGIVPSRFGFHIIKVDEVDGDEIRARHILARVAPGPDDFERARAIAESIRQRAVAGADFGALADEHSDDLSSGPGGELGWFRAGEMSPAVEEAVRTVGAGGIAPVVDGDNGYYVIKVLEHEEQRVAALDEVREELRDYIYGMKAEKAYAELMAQLRSEIYVDIRTEREPVGETP